MRLLDADAQTKRQLELETSAVEEGARRFRRLLHSRPTAKTKPGLTLLRRSIDSLICATQDEQQAICEGKSALHERVLLLSLSPQKLAFIALQTALNMVTWKELPSVLDVATKIGGRCFRQWNYERQERRKRRKRQQQLDKLPYVYSQLPQIYGELPRIYSQLLLRHADPQSTKAQKRAADLASKVEGDWTKDDRAVLLGSTLLDLVLKHSGIVEATNIKVSSSGVGESKPDYRTRKVVQLTDNAHDWLFELQSRYEQLATPIYLPMIVPPVAWTGAKGGGYLTNQDKTLHDIHLVKHHNNPVIIKAVNNAELKIPLAAVNALQETAWRVNTRIYNYVHEAWRKHIQLPGLPERNPLPLPAPPDNDSEEAIEQYNRALYEMRRMNKRLAAELTNFYLRMRACKKLIGEERLYFPYQLDWRGRVYPIPQALDPQADDVSRALLEFADGKHLGERGEIWLAVHLANTAGQDKLPFACRVEWVRKHEHHIHRFVKNPLDAGHPFWQEADKPWCLLAACMEWVEHSAPNFQSRIPVMVDGTCNGLQHLSAMGRDPEGGRWTNLLPSDRPQDIYQKVANLVVPHVRADADKGKSEASFWLNRANGIDRKVVKQPTMTTPYGVTPRGVEDQLTNLLIDEERKQCRVKGRQIISEDWRVARQRAEYLSPIVRRCIKEVVVKATDIMNWLEEVAKALVDDDQGVYWTTPAGFPVALEYRNPEIRRIKTKCGKLTVYEQNSAAELNKNEQKKIAPHFIHSMDAAHLMLTVARLRKEDKEELRDFNVIHDSYGVHACDVDHLNKVLREEFVKMYTKDVLADFLQEQRRRNLDTPPPQGNLDIQEVLNSEYFFA